MMLEVFLEDVQQVTVKGNRHGIEIMPRGYGDSSTQPGHGCPVFLERHEGKLQLLVWANINQQDPTHIIPLEGAKESQRLLEGCEIPSGNTHEWSM